MFKLCFWREGQVSTLWPMNHFVWLLLSFKSWNCTNVIFSLLVRLFCSFVLCFTDNFEVTLWVINVIYMFLCAYNIDCKHSNEYTGLFSYYYVTFFANFRMTQRYCAYASLIKCSISYDFKDLWNKSWIICKKNGG